MAFAMPYIYRIQLYPINAVLFIFVLTLSALPVPDMMRPLCFECHSVLNSKSLYENDARLYAMLNAVLDAIGLDREVCISNEIERKSVRW